MENPVKIRVKVNINEAFLFLLYGYTGIIGN